MASSIASDSLEEWLIGSWAELLDIEAVGIDDDFFDLGGQSILAAHLFSWVRRDFGVTVPLASLFAAPTIRSLAKVLGEYVTSSVDTSPSSHATRGPESWPCLVPIQTVGTRPSLFIVHGASGNVLNLRDMAVELGADQPLYGLQAWGLNGVDAADSTIEAMAARYVAEVCAFQPSGPYCVGGYSGGGVIALEMARALQEAGKKVGLLALIDTPSPDLGSRTFRQKWHGRMRRLRRLGPGYAARWLAARTTHLAASVVGRSTPTIPLDEGYIDMTAAFNSAWAVYHLRSYDGDATMFRSNIKDYDFYPPEFGWGRWITGDVDVCYVPTDHYGMVYEPAVRILCDHLGRLLEQLPSPGPA